MPLKYSVQEMPTPGYPKRTEKNIVDSDGTVIFTHGKLSGGSALTKKYAVKHQKPWIHFDMLSKTPETAALELAEWTKQNCVEVLNVAGRSASKDEKIYDVTFSAISALLQNLKN